MTDRIEFDSIRPAGRRLVSAALAAFCAFVTVACSDEPTAPLTPPAPVVGSIVVVVAVTGQGRDADGFAVSVDGRNSRVAVASGAALLFPDLSPGIHIVSLDGVASHCIMREANSQLATVFAREATAVVFILHCLAQGTGGIVVHMGTPGFDRFTATLDDGPVLSATDGTVLFSDLAPGPHSVRLHIDAGICLVDEPNPRPTSVTAGQVNHVSFFLTCPSATGILVTVSTTGINRPASYTAYIVQADDAYCYLYTCQNQFVNANGSVRFDRLSPGAYYVVLRGVPGNCVASPGSYSVEVVADSLARAPFAVQCT